MSPRRLCCALLTVGAVVATGLVAAPSASADPAVVTVRTWDDLQREIARSHSVTLDADIDSHSNERLEIPAGASVVLDLAGHRLTVMNSVPAYKAAVSVPEGAFLEVTSSEDGGRLDVTSGYGAAGIGGDLDVGDLGADAGVIAITGQTVVTARGGADGGAGIGGGQSGAGGSVTIGDTSSVTAIAGTGGGGAAGIGGGWNGAGGDLTIGGSSRVEAIGSARGAGIGSGGAAAAGTVRIEGASRVTARGGAAGIGGGYESPDGGTVIIAGGTVTAAGGDSGAGIGGGFRGAGGTIEITGGSVTADGGMYGAGIGGGHQGAGGSIEITGGSVNATGGAYGADIGGGYTGAGADLTVAGGELTVTGPIAFGRGDRATGSSGSWSNSGRVTIAAGSTWTLPDGVEATNAGDIVLNGTIKGAGKIVNTGRILGSGSVDNDGQGPCGVPGCQAPTVSVHNWVVYFSTAWGGPLVPIMARTIADAGLTLPVPSLPDGYTFTGWYYPTVNGDVRVTATTDLLDLLGTGPQWVSVYADYTIDQRIDFTSTPPAPAVLHGTYTPTATGGDSGKEVVFSIDAATTNSACSIAGGVVSFDHAGTCVIAADQAGEGSYLPAPTAVQTIEVGRASQAITFDTGTPTSATVGESHTLAAAGGGSGKPVTFSVATTTTNDACSITDDVVSFDHPGTCVIAADQTGDGDHLAAPTLTHTVAVRARTSPSSVTIGLSTDTPVYGQPVTATATPSTAGTIQFFLDGRALGSPMATTGTISSPTLTDAFGAPLAPGSHTVSVSFTPTDPQLTASSDGTAFTIGRAATDTVVSIAADQLTATVAAAAPGAGTPSGSVTFSVGDQTVGTATLTSGLAVLDHKFPSADTVTASYAGDDRFTGSSAVTRREGPALDATVTGEQGANGWYVGPVTVTYTCVPATAALTEPCPEPVTIKRNGADHTVTTTITALDGGSASVATTVKIDKRRPTVKIRGAKPRTIRCVARDAHSGLTARGCTLDQKLIKKKHTLKQVVRTYRYTATATDRAGNKATKKITIEVRTKR